MTPLLRAKGQVCLALGAVLAATLVQPACTAVGYAVGSHVDGKKRPRPKPVDKGALDTLGVGEQVEVTLWDGREVTGRYRGLQWAKPEEYAARYEAASQALEPDTAPALGPGARLVVTSGSQATGTYLGLGPAFVRFHEPGFPAPSNVELHRVATLADASGVSVSGARLQALLSERRLPTLAALAIEQPQRDTMVQHADVASINRLVKPHGGRLTGSVIGLAIDIGIYAALVTADYY